jgi:hypothetical protein
MYKHHGTRKSVNDTKISEEKVINCAKAPGWYNNGAAATLQRCDGIQG